MKFKPQIVILAVSLTVVVVKGLSLSRSQGPVGPSEVLDPDHPSAAVPSQKTARDTTTAKRGPSIISLREESVSKASDNVARAFQSALAMGNPYEREFALAAVMDFARSLDPALSENALKATDWKNPPDPLESNLQIELLKNWAEVSPAAALDWIGQRGLPDIFTMGILPEVTAAMWRSDPEAAIAFVDKMPSGDLYNAAYANLAGVMARTDLGKALEFANSFPDGPAVRQQCLDTIAQVLAEADPEKAMAEFLRCDSGPFKSMLGAAAATSLANQDPRKAMEFTSQLDDGIRTGTVEAIGIVWANSDPKGMAGYLDSMKPGSERDRLLRELGKHWSRYHPEEAAEWFGQLVGKTASSPADLAPGVPSLIASALAGSAIASNIFELDPARGQEWLNGIDDGPVRDGILTNVLGNDMVPDREEAFKMALTFSSATQRLAESKKILERISADDPAAARGLASSADLPLAERAELMKAIAR